MKSDYRSPLVSVPLLHLSAGIHMATVCLDLIQCRHKSEHSVIELTSLE
jgi:hypothetical protein